MTSTRTPKGQPACRPARRMRRCPRGLTLVDSLMTLLIVVGLIGASLYWLNQVTQRHATEAVAALLETDLRHARSQALAIDAPIRFELQTRPDGSSCYMTHTGQAGACQCATVAAASCRPGVRLIQAAEQPLNGRVRIVHSGRTLTFDPGKGTVTPTATFVVRGADGGEIRQVINLMGRVRSCSNDRLAGLRQCG